MKTFVSKLIIYGLILSGFNAMASQSDITVMIIDTGISKHHLLTPWVQYDASGNYEDDNGHGTHIAGIVAMGSNELSDPICSNVKIFACKEHNNVADSILCLKLAIRYKVDYINYSLTGPEFDPEEYHLFEKYVNQGGTVFIAAGNEGKDLRTFGAYLAGYAFGFSIFKPLKNIIVVQNECNDGLLCPSSNTHPFAQQFKGEAILSTYNDGKYAKMTGTSQATPGLLHLVLKEQCSQLTKGNLWKRNQPK